MLDLCSPLSYNNDVNPLVFWYNNRFSTGSIGPIYNFKIDTPPTSNYNFSWLNFGNNNIYGSIWSGIGPVYNFKGTGSRSVNKTSTTTLSTSQNISSSKTTEQKVKEQEKPKVSTKELNSTFISNAEKYIGCKEGDKTYSKFSSSPEWCADFISYVVKETYKEKGLETPKGFVNHRVEDIKQWGIKNNKFLDTTQKENKDEYIAKNIKPGNIMILRENGASHIGIVTKVNSDGSFETIEGNVRLDDGKDYVVRQSYNANYSDLSGFIKLSV